MCFFLVFQFVRPVIDTFFCPGAMRTTISSDGMAYTLSSYTRIINGVPTIGVVTLGPIQTYYQGKLLSPGQNAYGVPNQGIAP